MLLSPNLRGSLFMMVAMAGFTANDSLAKLASADMNVGQVMLVRGLFASALIFLLAWHQDALRSWRTIMIPAVAARMLGEISATVTFLVALTHLPLANTSAILQALPLAITLAAALFLKEPVGWRRWLAIIVGFCGVLIIVRPGLEGFNAFSLFAMLSVLCCTLRDLATRRIPPEVPSLFVSTLTALTVTVGGAVLLVPFGGWSPMGAGSVGILFLAAVLVLVGYQGVILAMRTGDIAAIAPFRYTALIWALIISYLIFNEIPDGPMITGASIIVGSGLYAFYRERKRAGLQPASNTTGPSMAPDGL